MIRGRATVLTVEQYEDTEVRGHIEQRVRDQLDLPITFEGWRFEAEHVVTDDEDHSWTMPALWYFCVEGVEVLRCECGLWLPASGHWRDCPARFFCLTHACGACRGCKYKESR